MREVKAILAAEKADSLSSTQSSKLTAERKRALDYYMGDISADIPAEPGRSKAVSSDVADTVLGLMPGLMEIFAGSDDAVRFEPVGPEDVDAADQETEFVKHIFWNRNDGFLVLYSMIFDALLSKLGVAKVWQEEKKTEERETYYNQSDEQLAMVLMDKELEIVEHSIEEGPYGASHDFTVLKKYEDSCTMVGAVPPEEFGIAKRARNMRDAHYVYHEPNGGKAAADLIAEGYDKQQINGLPTYSSAMSEESNARDTVNESNEPGGDEGMNKAMRPILVTEHYIRMDYEGDGFARLYRVVTGGDDSTVLKRNGKPDIEEIDFIPFAAITPYIMPHRVHGRSVADVVIDIQQQKSVILRQSLDNLYATNQPRPVVVESLSTPNTLEDLSVHRHGVPVRVRQPGAIEWQVVPSIVDKAFPMIQYLDSVREWRTGVTRQGMGLDADALSNQSATAAMQLHNAATARQKMIARGFAETGIKDLFWLLHAMVRKHAKKQEIVRLTNKWVPIDPRNWKARNDITVSVGLGQGGKTQRLQELQMVIAAQREAMLQGLSKLTDPLTGKPAPMIMPKHLYNSAKEVCKILEQDVELFFSDPGEAPPPEPQSPEKIKGQIEMMKLQAESQLKNKEMQGKAAIEKLQAEADVATNDRKIQADIALAERKFQFDSQLKREEFMLERELKMIEIGARAQQHEMDIEKAEMGMVTDQHKAELGLAAGAEKAHMDSAARADRHSQDSAHRDEQHKQRMKEAKAKSGEGGPISKAMKELMAMQKQVLEAVDSEREIEIKRDERGKTSGAVSRRKKK